MAPTSSRLLTLDEAAERLLPEAPVGMRLDEAFKLKLRQVERAKLLLLLGTSSGVKFQPMFKVEDVDAYRRSGRYLIPHPMDQYRSSCGCPVHPLGVFDDHLRKETLCAYRDSGGRGWALTPAHHNRSTVAVLFSGKEDWLREAFPRPRLGGGDVGWDSGAAVAALLEASFRVGEIDPCSVGFRVDQRGRWMWKRGAR